MDLNIIVCYFMFILMKEEKTTMVSNEEMRPLRVWDDVLWEMQKRVAEAATSDLGSLKQPDFLPSISTQGRELLAQKAKDEGVEMPEKQFVMMETAISLCVSGHTTEPPPDIKELMESIGVRRAGGEEEKGDEDVLRPGEALTRREKRDMLEEILRRLREREVPPPEADPE